jgi:hypothetical protein
MHFSFISNVTETASSIIRAMKHARAIAPTNFHESHFVLNWFIKQWC